MEKNGKKWKKMWKKWKNEEKNGKKWRKNGKKMEKKIGKKWKKWGKKWVEKTEKIPGIEPEIVFSDKFSRTNWLNCVIRWKEDRNLWGFRVRGDGKRRTSDVCGRSRHTALCNMKKKRRDVWWSACGSFAPASAAYRVVCVFCRLSCVVCVSSLCDWGKILIQNSHRLLWL